MRQVETHHREPFTERPSKKTREMVGLMLLLAGVVLGMAVAMIQRFSIAVQVGLLALALVLVAIGLFLNRKFRVPEP